MAPLHVAWILFVASVAVTTGEGRGWQLFLAARTPGGALPDGGEGPPTSATLLEVPQAVVPSALQLGSVEIPTNAVELPAAPQLLAEEQREWATTARAGEIAVAVAPLPGISLARWARTRVGSGEAVTGQESPDDEEEEEFLPPEEPEGWGLMKALLLDALLTLSIYVILLILYAVYYEKSKEYPVDAPNDGLSHTPEDLDGKWKFGFCDCWSDPCMCLLSWCCPAVRWADTVRMGGYLGFWCALPIYFIFSLLSNSGAFIAGAIPLAMLGTYYRQKLRARFSIAYCTCGTIAFDCFAYCFCPCLAINQEARTMDEAYLVMHPAVEDARRNVMKHFELNRAQEYHHHLHHRTI